MLGPFISSAIAWATDPQNQDNRVRVYMQWTWPALQKLIDKPLATAPYFVDSSDGRRTVAVVTSGAWTKAFQAAGGRTPIDWTVIHHAIAGTMLTHPLSPHDPAGTDI